MKGPSIPKELIEEYMKQKKEGKMTGYIPYVPVTFNSFSSEKLIKEIKPKKVPVEDERVKRLKELKESKLQEIRKVPIPYFLQGSPEYVKLMYQDLKYSQEMDKAAISSLLLRINELERQLSNKKGNSSDTEEEK